jgi:hypothetical protein
MLLLIAVSFSAADPVKPGKLHILKEEDKAVTAAPGDIVVARIMNSSNPMPVSDVDIKTSGGIKLAGVVDAEDFYLEKPVPGGTHVKIVLSVVGGARSGTLDMSYKDVQGHPQKRTVQIQITGR